MRQFSGSGKALATLPRSMGFGALPKSMGFGAMPSGMYAGIDASTFLRQMKLSQQKVSPVVVTPQVMSNVIALKGAIDQGVKPNVTQSINVIKTLIPPKHFSQNLRPPTQSGNRTISNLSGVGLSQMYPTMGYLGYGGNAAGTNALVSSAAGSLATAAATGSSAVVMGMTIGSVAGPIGIAVGVVVGVVLGLFAKKKPVPKVKQADVQQANTWMQQYTQIAGSVVGRHFTADSIHDMLTATAILDPGFWGNNQSTDLPIPAISNFVNDEAPKRMNDFFNAMQAVPIGGTVTMSDDCSIIGHGKKSCHPEKTFSFVNPGVNAPSYILGPLFAQYFYTMCMIFVSAQNCSSHLTAPIPQLYTDFLDYFRSSRPGWDTPQPNIVTGTDVSVAAPRQVNTTQTVATVPTVRTSGNTYTASPPALPPPAASTVNISPAASTVNISPAASTVNISPAANVIPVAPLDTTPETYGASSYIQPVPDSGASSVSPLAPHEAGMNWAEIALLGAVALPLLLGFSRHHKHDHR